MILHSLVADKRLLKPIPTFKWLNCFLKNFLLRPAPSLRERTARRPEINDKTCSAFLCALNKAQGEVPLDRFMNFNESNSHLTMSGDEAMGEISSKKAHKYVDSDARANCIYITSICPDRSHLLLILIARGAMKRCHKSFSEHPDYQHSG
jgi:hypothetical protein